jgi:predicted acetyltransferase
VVLVVDLGSETAISWKVFKHEFNRHFFPRVMQEAKAQEFLDLVQGEMSMIEYAAMFLQLSRFGLYLILTEEKKAKKLERGLNSRIQIMMSCFDIRDFSQLVDKASFYEESLKENAVEYANQKKRTQGTCTSVEGAGPAKRMAVGSFPP